MKRLTMTMLALCAALTVAAQAQRQLFDDGWQFTREGNTVSVNLPHDWDIYCAPDPATGATKEGGGWYPGGKGEYKKTFKTPDAEIVRLHFEGVYQKAEVFVNGQKAGQHAYGYTPFTVTVTPFLHKDKKKDNEVVVRVDNSQQPNCRWYSGSGIYRHVWLLTTGKLYIAENGVSVTTSEVSEKSARVNVAVVVVNESDKTRDLTLVINGKKSHLKLAPGEATDYHAFFNVDNPQRWSPDSPYLYQASVTLEENNRIVDERTVSYGIRSFSFDAKQGFVLNGKPLLINGACVHHDDGVLGAMAFDAAEIRKVRLMKEAGFNLIRTSHNPTTSAFLDACDSIGMLVIGEAFDGWRTAKNPYDYSTLIDSCYRDDIHAMVLRDRNHPSVICWSIGNEVIERKDIRVVTTAKKLKEAILECDDTRPVTEALCAWDDDWEIYDPHFDVLDIGGYNYMIHKHASDHQRSPKRVMWQTESFPRDAFRNWALVQDYPYIVGDIVWTGLDYLGESGIGRNYYEGERPGEHYVTGGQPEWHGAYCGDVDITGWRKPISHYREILWQSEKGKVNSEAFAAALYMAVKEPDGYRGKIHQTAWSVWPTWESWNWEGWEGKPIDVEVYTKAPEVTLYLNDRLIDTKAVSRETEYKAVFSVPYEPGTLRAVVGNASELCESVVGNASERCNHADACNAQRRCPLHATLSTAGEPAALRLTPDRRVIGADGQDLAFITVEVIDKEGRVCPDAAIDCEAVAKGAGSLLAFASADLKDTEPYTSSRAKTWHGRALLVVRSSQKRGTVSLSVRSTLPTANLTIKTDKGL